LLEWSDERLLEGARKGQEACWTALYQRHQARLYRFAFHMSGSTAIAEDAVQETFLALLSQLDRFAPDRGTFSSYLLGIARNKVLAALQREPFGTEEISDDLDSIAPSHDVALDQERLRKAILGLPPGYREAVVLCELEEMDYAAAAVVLGCAVGTIKSRLHRAKQILMARLSPEPRRIGAVRKGCLP
jgi:RNA polymerase sigma-70 factor (ECF subfamily)